jgi:hypothetical protein
LIGFKKVLWVTSGFLRTVDTFRTRRRGGPNRFTQKQPPTCVSAKERAAVETAKNQLSRDFRCGSIFDVFNSISQKLTFLEWQPAEERPLVARNGHVGVAWRCPLIGAKETSRRRAVTSGFDPSRKSSTPFAVTYEAATLPSGRAKLLSSG